jgi:hypothetical protein
VWWKMWLAVWCLLGVFGISMGIVAFWTHWCFVADCMAAEGDAISCSAKYSVASTLTFWPWQHRYIEDAGRVP